MHEQQLFLRKNTRKKLDFVLFLIEMSLFCGENTDFLSNWLTIQKIICNFVAKLRILTIWN